MIALQKPPLTVDPRLRDVAFKIADSSEELRDAFRLVYASYLRAGLARPNPFELRITPWHLMEGTEVFVAKLRSEVIATVSLVVDGEMGIPMESLYSEQVSHFRQRRLAFGEVTCLADRRRSFVRSLPVVIRLMGLMGQTARRRGLNRLLVVVHPRHARFYKRLLGFEPIGEERAYSAVCGKPAVALALDLNELAGIHPRVHETLFQPPFSESELRWRPVGREVRQLFNETHSTVFSTDITQMQDRHAELIA